MKTWKTLYISGRLQKPISILVDEEDVGVLNVNNLKSALYAALLLAPPEFTEEELYINICSLSYLGDIRMFFAEDKRKVQKIVRGSTERFQELYRASVRDAEQAGFLCIPSSFGVDPQARLVQNGNTAEVAALVAGLPKAVLAHLGAQTGVTDEAQSSAISMAVAQSKEGHQQLVRRAIGRIVRRSSIRQSFSGFFAAGGVNALHYFIQKSSKAWRSGCDDDEEQNWFEDREAVNVIAYAIGEEGKLPVEEMKFQAHHDRSVAERSREELGMAPRPMVLLPLLHRPKCSGNDSDRIPPWMCRLQLVVLPFPLHIRLFPVHTLHASAAASLHDVSRGGNRLTLESRKMRHPSVQ
ncbi:hypothetical protein R1flu_017709 [Riccia fluitans]|uniref:Phosphatidate cytidylyltransferase, mitochondrial n=1 Tax=Riccia fluitans TaxID=41844 RepID=A0ABD1ZG34_9MARC